MDKKEKKGGANIGSASLILIFIVMCLGTFGLLSLSSAGNDRTLSDRNGAAVTAYYAADLEGAKLYWQLKKESGGLFAGNLKVKELAEGINPDITVLSEETDRIIYEVPMANSQALHVELSLDQNGVQPLGISQWKVVSSEDFAIDQRMPVWDGK